MELIGDIIPRVLRDAGVTLGDDPESAGIVLLNQLIAGGSDRIRERLLLPCGDRLKQLDPVLRIPEGFGEPLLSLRPVDGGRMLHDS